MSVHSFQYSRLSQNPDEESDFSTLQEQKPGSVESYSPQQYRPTYFELHNVYE